MAYGDTPLWKQSLRDPSHGASLVGPSLLRCRGRHVLQRGVSPSSKTGGKRGRSNQIEPSVHKNGGKTWTATGVAAVIVGLGALAAAVYIMVNGIGLNPDLDFGAGAYYYADIPDYQKTLNWDVYAAQLPFWVYLLLFLGWGWLMWRLWKWIEK